MKRYTLVSITRNALHVWNIIRSSKLYTQHRVYVERFLLLAAIVSSTNTRCCVYSFELLMMGGGTAWNMWSIYSNEYHCVTLHIVGFVWKNVFVDFGTLRINTVFLWTAWNPLNQVTISLKTFHLVVPGMESKYISTYRSWKMLQPWAKHAGFVRN